MALQLLFWQINQVKKIETTNMLIDEKNLVNCFTRYVCRKSIKMLNLYYDELMGKMEEVIWKKILHGLWLYAG